MPLRDTNAYFQTASADDGMLFLSICAQDGGRLLIPDDPSSALLDQMKRGNILKLFQVGSGAYIIFDDHSGRPPILNLNEMQLEIEEQRPDSQRPHWFPLMAWGPYGYLHTWLCRWCDSREKDRWLAQAFRSDANLL